MEAGVRGGKRAARVFRDLHALAFRADDDAVRIFRIDQNRIHDPLDRSQALPLVDAFVGRLPEAAGRSGIKRIRMLRVLADKLGTAINERNPRVPLPRFAGIHAAVDAGARSCVDVRRVCSVHDNGHDVGIVNHACLNGSPVLAAVCRLPGQVIGPCVNNVFVFRVKRDRVKVAQVVVIRGRDAFPGAAVILRTINAGQRTSDESLWIRGRLRERADGFFLQTNNVPAPSCVLGAVYAAAAGIERPRAGVQVIRIARVHQNVRNDVILANADSAQQLPMLAFVCGRKDVPVRCAEVELLRILRIRFERNHGSAWRPNLPPGSATAAANPRANTPNHLPFISMQFSQSAEALTRQEFRVGRAGGRLSKGTESGQIFIVLVPLFTSAFGGQLLSHSGVPSYGSREYAPGDRPSWPRRRSRNRGTI